MKIPPLTKLLIHAPSCQVQTTGAEILKLCRQGLFDRVVLCNEHQSPTGLIRLSQFFLQWETDSPLHHTPLSCLPPEQFDLIVEPISIFPAARILEDPWSFLLELRQHPDCAHWGMVDSNQGYAGLLDPGRYLQVLAANWPLDLSALPLRSLSPTLRRAAQAMTQSSVLPASLLASDLSRLDVHIAAQKVEQSVLDITVQVLEQIPLPLMLQTSKGQALMQNAAWRTRFSKLRDPGWVQQSAAVLLGATDLGRTHMGGDTQALSLDIARQKKPVLRQKAITAVPDALNGLEQSGDKQPANLCQAGQRTDTCICACPMQNGEDHVLQFAAVRMHPSPQVRHQASDNAFSAHPFQLASLESDPKLSVPDRLSETGLLDFTRAADTEDLWLVIAQDAADWQSEPRQTRPNVYPLPESTSEEEPPVEDKFLLELLSFVSHELKTPLTSILGLSQLLTDQRLGGDRPNRYIHLIRQNSQHLTRILHHVTDITRIETGHVELAPQQVDTEAVCRRALAQAIELTDLAIAPPQISDASGAIAQAEGQAHRQPDLFTSSSTEHSPDRTVSNLVQGFILEIDPGLKTLWMDELRFGQMLTHLLSNALQFTDATGSIGLRVESWTPWIAVTVWDTGIGIPIDQQHLLGQTFQRPDNPLAQEVKGTGLGLILVQRLARLQGGDLMFESQPQVGSQFTLLLPDRLPETSIPSPLLSPQPSPLLASQASLGKLQKHEKPQAHPDPKAAAIVLVVMTPAIAAELKDLIKQLRQLGLKVAIAHSGPDALQKVRRFRPSAVFMSPNLSLLSGWEALKHLKSAPETAHIPVLLVPASTRQETICYQSQADRVVTVPVAPRKLWTILSQLTQVSLLTSPDDQLAKAPAKTAETASSKMPSNPSDGELSGLTILYLNTDAQNSAEPTPLSLELNRLLEIHQCRFLEVDDVDQAALLSRVWQPDVMVLDPAIADPKIYLQYLAQRQEIAALPLVTLTQAATQAANQLPDLLVFPCLAPLESTAFRTPKTASPSTLLQVIRIAAGLEPE